MRNKWIRRFAVFGVTALVKVLRRTWRVRVVGDAPTGTALLAAFHGDQVALTVLPQLRNFRRHKGCLHALISRSADGQLAAGVHRRLGFGIVRGSSSRGAIAGACALMRRLRAGQSAIVAVDGPRGPRHRAPEAPRRLARLGGAILVPVAAVASRGLRLRSWDQLQIPAPFARVYVVFGAAVKHGLQRQLRQTWASAYALANRGRSAGLLHDAPAAPGLRAAPHPGSDDSLSPTQRRVAGEPVG